MSARARAWSGVGSEGISNAASSPSPAGSFKTLLTHLATLTDNRIVPAGLDERAAFNQLSVPTPLQDRAFELLGFTAGSV